MYIKSVGTIENYLFRGIAKHPQLKIINNRPTQNIYTVTHPKTSNIYNTCVSALVIILELFIKLAIF